MLPKSSSLKVGSIKLYYITLSIDRLVEASKYQTPMES